MAAEQFSEQFLERVALAELKGFRASTDNLQRTVSKYEKSPTPLDQTQIYDVTTNVIAAAQRAQHLLTKVFDQTGDNGLGTSTFIYTRSEIKKLLLPLKEVKVRVILPKGKVGEIPVGQLALHRFFDGFVQFSYAYAHHADFGMDRVRQLFLQVRNSTAALSIEPLDGALGQLEERDPNLKTPVDPEPDLPPLKSAELDELKELFKMFNQPVPTILEHAGPDFLASLLKRVTPFEGSPAEPLKDNRVEMLRDLREQLAELLDLAEDNPDLFKTRFKTLGEEGKSAGAKYDATRAKQLMDIIDQILEKHEAAIDIQTSPDFIAWRDGVNNTTRVSQDSLSISTLVTYLNSKRSANPESVTQADADTLQEAEQRLEGQRGSVGSTRYFGLSDEANQRFAQAKAAYLTERINELAALRGAVDAELQRQKTAAKNTATNTTTTNTPTPAEIKRPDTDDAAKWNIYLEALYEKSPEQFANYVAGLMPLLDNADRNFTQRNPTFKNARQAIEFVRVKEFLDNLENQEDRLAFYKQKVPPYNQSLAEMHQVIAIRLELVDFMGPSGNSPRGDAEFKQLINRFPDLSLGKYSWLTGSQWLDSVDPQDHSQRNPEKPHWKFSEEVALAIDRMAYLMQEPRGGLTVWYEGCDEDDATLGKKQFAQKAQFSFDTSQWMGQTGDFNVKFENRMIAEAKAPAGKVEPGAKWLVKPLNQYQEFEIREIWRIAYLQFITTRGRQVQFMEFAAGGASPPGFVELEDVYHEYPLAQTLNLASKKVFEIPEVCTGLKIDRFWLAKVAKHRGIFDFIVKQQKAGNMKHIGTYLFKKTDSDIDALNPDGDENKQREEEKKIEAFFWQIANDHEERKNVAYTRFRDLVRSIFLSEAKAHWLDIKHIHPMHLQNGRAQHDRHGFHLVPFVVSPYQMVTGEMAGFYAENGFRFDNYVDIAKVAGEFHEKINEPPPEKGKDDENTQYIIKLWTDFEKCLGFTSKFRSSADQLINWDEVAEALEYRLRVLFAAYRKAFDDDPATIHDRSVSDLWAMIPKERRSMVGYFVFKLSEGTGQTMDGVKVKKVHHGHVVEEEVWNFQNPYKKSETGLSLKEYLRTLIDESAGGPSILGRARRSAVYTRMLVGTNRITIGNPKWKEYVDLVKDWRADDGMLDEVLLQKSKAHAAAKAVQTSENKPETAH